MANYTFKSKFYFDIGYNIDERNILRKPNEKIENYRYPKLNRKYYSIKEHKGYYPNIRGGSSKFKIRLLKNNQGYELLDSDHKIVWSYINFNKFHFSSFPVIWARNQMCGIGSKNKNELLYLFSILNSLVTNVILESNLKSENEKDFLVSIASIKEFVRIPRINDSNKVIKYEIIKIAGEILSLEDVRLSNFVDFSRVMLQKFDDVLVRGNNLVLCKDKEKRKLKITSKKALVKKTIDDKYGSEELQFEGKRIALSELKFLPTIDLEKQTDLKDYIDDLVFALYFNIPLTKVGLKHRSEIKKECQKNKFYKLLNKLS